MQSVLPRHCSVPVVTDRFMLTVGHHCNAGVAASNSEFYHALYVGANYIREQYPG